MERLLLRGAFWTTAVLAALIFAVLAAVFLCGAVYLYVSEVTSRPLAALATAGVALLLALLVLAAAYLLSAARWPGGSGAARPRAGRNGAPIEDQLAAELGNLLGREYAAFAKEHTIQALLLSLAGGFAVGASPKLRAFLLGLLKR